MEGATKNKIINIMDAQKTAKRFLLGKNPKAEIIIDKVILKDVGSIPIYELEGKIIVKRGFLSGDTVSLFTIQVHAYESRVVGYEIIESE